MKKTTKKTTSIQKQSAERRNEAVPTLSDVDEASRDIDVGLTLDVIDRAGRDVAFIYGVLDVISELSMMENFDEMPGSTITALCSEALDKTKNLKRFVEAAAHR